MTTAPLSLKIAGYTALPIPTGVFKLDGGAMFGTVPKVLWEKSNPADDKNRILMEARALLLVSDNRKILIDTGNGADFIAKHGEKLGTKFAEMYGVDKSGPSLMSSLQKYNLLPEQITDVILTHLHFDHAGGATTEKEGQIVPTFPQATYHIQKSNLETALNPNKRERASYLKANIEPLVNSQQLKIHDGSIQNALPGIHFFISNGHTQGQQAVIVEDAHARLIYCGDVIATSSHVRSAWVMGYDIDPLKIMQEKQQILQLSQNKKTYYFYEHDPYCDLSTVKFENDDFKADERFHLVSC